MAEDDTATADAAQEQADFGSGFSGVETKPDKPDAPETAETPRAEAEPEPEKFVQISEKDWADVRAAAAKTASYDAQLAKAFGTIGNLSKLVNEQRAKDAAQAAPDKPAARKIEIPKDAFAAMERDFPELAQQTRAALEAALSGLPVGANDVEPAKIESMLAQYNSRREIEALEDAHPDWKDITGAVPIGVKPDPEHPFRKWLSTKNEAYQQKINDAASATVLSRAINLFQKETATPTKPAAPPRDTGRADRIRGAVQPRGDAGGVPAPDPNKDFMDGFNSR